MENVFKLLFPSKCVICNRYEDVVCNHCLNEGNFSEYGVCTVCDEPSLDGFTHTLCMTRFSPSQIISPFKYEENIRLCIKRSKFGVKNFAVLKRLTQFSKVFLGENNYTFRDFIVMPIPLSKSHYRERGFNQAETIAVCLAKLFSLKVDLYSLKRYKETTFQYQKNRKERFENLKDAFIAVCSLEGKNILLVDDISTTGATFLEAAKALYTAGARDVKCFSLSKRF